MQLVNWQGATIGAGSEWFWSMAQFVIVAVTFLAIYYQLRLQRHTAAIDQGREIAREWTHELLARARYDVLTLIRDGADPARTLSAEAISPISGRISRTSPGREASTAGGMAFQAEVNDVEARGSDAGAIDEVTSAQRTPEPLVKDRPSVLVRLAGAVLVVAGIIGLLEVPIVWMFSEGIPDSWANNQGAYIGLWAATSLACLVAGIGVFRGRAWARFLAIGLYVVLALSMAPTLPLQLIALAFAGVLVFGWRGSFKRPS